MPGTGADGRLTLQPDGLRDPDPMLEAVPAAGGIGSTHRRYRDAVPGGDPQRWKAAFGNPPESHTAALCRHMLWISAWWKVHRRSIRRLYREAAAGIEDDVIDGAAIARQLAVEAGLRFPYDYASSYPWCGATREHGICAQR